VLYIIVDATISPILFVLAEIKRRDANFHVCTSRLSKPSRSGDFVTSQHSAKVQSDDSVVKGVLVAMDYDVDKLNTLYPKTS